MLTLKIACSAFNDKDNIKRHLTSIPQYIHHELWDGRYKDFNYPTDLSNDGTREVAQSYFNSVVFDAGGYTEIEKRQKYLDNFDPNTYKFLLVVDSDEFFRGDWQDFILELDEYYERYKNDKGFPIGLFIDVMNPPTGIYDPRPRLWINAHNIRMGPRHNQYKSKVDGSVVDAINRIKSMKIDHNYRLRYPSYDELRKAYQHTLLEQEKKLV